MESKIIQSTKNPFLKREELTLEIKSEATPKESEVIEAMKEAKEI